MKERIERLKRYYKESNSAIKLIIINLAVFVVFWLMHVIDFLFKLNVKGVADAYTILPSSFTSLAYRPWTLFTYMFRHLDFGHLFFNMLFFYFFGRLFVEYLGNKRLVSTFILGGMAGGLLYIIFFNIFPVFSEVVAIGHNLGASGAVMAIGAGIATYAPKAEIHLPFNLRVRVIWVVGFFILKDLLVFPEGTNAGGLLAHFGGALFGYFSIIQFKKGKDINAPFVGFVESIGRWFKAKPKVKKVYSKKDEKSSTRTKQKPTSDHQQKINEILDKINRSGYESLSKEEKDFLFKISDD